MHTRHILTYKTSQIIFHPLPYPEIFTSAKLDIIKCKYNSIIYVLLILQMAETCYIVTFLNKFKIIISGKNISFVEFHKLNLVGIGT